MIELLWKIEIGNGIIDCAISESKRIIVAGDVNGSVVLSDFEGKIINQHKFDLPVWGVDIDNSANIIAVGLANKVPAKGALIVIESGKIIIKESFESAVWDVKIVDDSRVFASTWKNGLFSYEYKSKKRQLIPYQTRLFGISKGPNQTILVTSSGEGVLCLDINNLKNIIWISKNRVACYKNAFAIDQKKIFYGSTSNLLSEFDIESKSDIRYKTILDQICGIAIFDDFILYGDLNGNFCISRIEYPNIPLLHIQFGEAIWSIAIDRQNSFAFIACGDGCLYCYKIDKTALTKSHFVASNEISIDPKLLRCAKVFITYASEDEHSARILYEGLKNAGCIPWMDKYNLLPGQDWKYEIKQAILNSDFVVVCLSKKSVTKKGYVQKEIKDALDILDQMPEGRIFLIPVKLDDCIIPDNLAERQWVDLFSEDGFYKLVLAIYLGKGKIEL